MATTIERNELSFGASSRVSSKRTRRIVILRIAVLAALIIGLTVAGYALGWFDLTRVARTSRTRWNRPRA